MTFEKMKLVSQILKRVQVWLTEFLFFFFNIATTSDAKYEKRTMRKKRNEIVL